MPTVELSAGPVHYTDTGSGPVVVCIHGLLVDGALWAPVAAALAEQCRVVVPDLPLGSHRHPMRPDADLSPAGLAALIAEFLDVLGLEEVTLVGNDTGGALCQLVAADHRERIGRLVLTNCDAYRRFPPLVYRPLTTVLPRVPGGVRGLTRLPLRALGLAYRPLSRRALPRKQIRAWVEPARGQGEIRRDLIKVLRGVTPKETVRAMAALRHFDRPTLLIWGERDFFFPKRQARKMARDIPDARVEWVAQGRTYTPLDEPAEVAGAIRRFAVKRRVSPAGA